VIFSIAFNIIVSNFLGNLLSEYLLFNIKSLDSENHERTFLDANQGFANIFMIHEYLQISIIGKNGDNKGIYTLG